MKIKGDVKCYHCGYVSGQLVGESNSPISSRLFIPSPTYKKPLPGSRERFACGRCGGSTYLDEIEVVRERPFRCVVDPYETKPGRRPGKKVKKTRKELHAACA